MKDAQAISEFVRDRIGHIYRRPRMYCGSPGAVDLVLHYYHELLAFLYDRLDNFGAAQQQVRHAINCPGAMSLSDWAKESQPDDADEILEPQLVQWWKQIDRQLGFPFDIE
jgi:hypothetical protein